ncbi:long-chain fatty acid--CoA ligase [Gloeocapsa sp. PCC 73106]|uniref:long-chain fatty acid--CoA ligase n=1 Tax=Gloeocapsa sp. PCC 73106 TaxID=102232 RepID=UPI0002AB9DF0|nr:long-chain fatty acid--CoA ligase [Gloeocapsa sp. PCC 73106]ELR98156.1 AMP-forming long-chain acyl-CoA synthetase [Gloeocapsa sp. PCC 73106]
MSRATVTPNYTDIQSLDAIWSIAAADFQDQIALRDPHSKPEVNLTYQDLNSQIKRFGAGLQVLGVTEGQKVALIADNSPRWFIADQGIMTAGGVDVVRSSQAEKQELIYIIKDSDSTALVVENQKTLEKLRSDLEDLPIALIILLSEEAVSENESLKVLNFSQLMELGSQSTLTPVSRNRASLATLIYTSGTTGKPKGVMLSHGNLLHQVNNLNTIIQPEPGDKVLSILPSWHSYERAAEYYILSQGCTQIYTNIRNFKQDLQKHQPNFMIGVPRLWESIYEGIQKQLREQPQKRQKLVKTCLEISESYILARRIAQGLSLEHLEANWSDRLKAGIKATALAPLHQIADRLVYRKIRNGVGGNLRFLISGGGSLAMHLENFYEVVGIPILVGYGLTETSPVTNARQIEHNLRGSAGKPLPETEIRIVDLETKQDLPKKKRGLVLLRGPQVMQGYYHQPEATAKAIDASGWFDTGDIGWLTCDQDLVLTGRAKDTIVLTNGENIEPQPIEDACLRSPYIEQIMLVGQDQRALGALIVPNLEALQQWAIASGLNLDFSTPGTQALNDAATQELFRRELNREVQNRPGYRSDDRIGAFAFVLEPFSLDNGMMTQTLKIKRPLVTQHYHDLIQSLFN